MSDRKRIFASEAAYVWGIVILALGTAMMEKADFGMSMVVAPAYLVHLAVPGLSFGTAEYCLQAVLFLALALILRCFRPLFLFSFVTAVVYGTVLDGMLALAAFVPQGGFAGRCVWYALGEVVCALGVSFLFHTYIAPEAYELVVKEVSAKFGTDIHKTKTVYDCVSCAAAVVLSFAFFGFGHFEGVKLGTFLCAPFNGAIIGLCSRALESRFEFRDRLPWREKFE